MSTEVNHGIVLGLLLLGKTFDFFAILGLLGLIGMNIKNAIKRQRNIYLQCTQVLIIAKFMPLFALFNKLRIL